MRLSVNKGSLGGEVFEFDAAPVHIGRSPHSQLLLADTMVSRHHAVLTQVNPHQWLLEDLGSVNKTYLNDNPVKKKYIATGDKIRIGPYTIEVDLQNHSHNQPQPEDKHAATQMPAEKNELGKAASFTRRFDLLHDSDLQVPPRRIKSFAGAANSICAARGTDEILLALLHVGVTQFTAFRCWAQMRTEPEGAMMCRGGRQRDGQNVKFQDLSLAEKIEQCTQKKLFLLLQNMPPDPTGLHLQSAMIVPILNQRACLGTIYIDNLMDHEKFIQSDLDYLIIIGIHTAAVLKNF